MKQLKAFLKDDKGAVTVDWVLLAAFIVSFAVLISDMMGEGALGLADAMRTYMQTWNFG